MTSVLRATAAAVAVVALSGFDFGGVKGDGNLREETRKVSDFKAVGVSHGIHATVRIGSPATARLKGDANLLSLIELQVEDGSLRTVVKDHRSLRPTRPIELELTTPSLEAVAASGGARLSATATPSEEFEAAASGGAVVKVSAVKADRVSVASSGGSDVTVSGAAKALAVSTSGGSKTHARGLVTAEAQVQGSGGATLELHVKERVVGALSGGSELTVEGNPAKRTVDTSGGSAAHFRS